MPSYKTHSIHAELVFDGIDKQTDVSKEAVKTFAMGPDALIATDYKTFKNMHKENVRDYYEALLKYYKENNLLDNPEAMAFLYGQLDHFMLDVVTHPLIYYLTEKAPKDHKIGPHGLVEMWMDDYHMQKYGKNQKFYYHKTGIKSKELKEAIDTVTGKIYGSEDVSKNYNKGIKIFSAFDSVVRNNFIGVMPLADKLVNMGDVRFKKDVERVMPYLNLDNQTWLNPETGEAFKTSFDDLFNKATTESQQLIHDVNQTLYQDRPLTNMYILNNTSYNTGLNCDLGQNYTFVKEYPLITELKEAFDKLDKRASKQTKTDIIRGLIVLTPCVSAYISSFYSKFDEYTLLFALSGLLGVSIYDVIKMKQQMDETLTDVDVRKRR